MASLAGSAPGGGLAPRRSPDSSSGSIRSLPASTGSEYSFGDGFCSLSLATSSISSFPRRLPTTKRDNPALTLLLGTNKQWVVWTPEGYYDTSIAGDSRFLGWHTNPPHDSVRPTDFVPIVTYSRTMNRPDILDQLWRLGDPNLVVIPAGTGA